MEVIPDPWFWAVAIPPASAAAIMLPLLCAMDLAGIRAYLGRWDLMPVGVGVIYFGLWLHKRIPALWFFRVIYAVLFLTGSKLLYDGVTGL